MALGNNRMQRHWRTGAALCVLAWSVSGHAQSAQSGMSGAGQPQNVVVYDLATLDTMQALGIAVTGVPKAQFPAYMAGYADARYTVAGSLFEPDYDVLSKIKPDLIIVGGRSAAKAEVLGKLAPTLDFSVKPATMLEDMERNIAKIAGMYGKQAQGEALVSRIQREVAELKQLSSQAAPGVLLMAVNEKIMPQAPGARFGFLFDVLGAKSALTAKDVPARGGPAYTFDDLAKLQPEWIYVIDRNTAVGSAAGGGEIIPSTKVFDNDKVKATPAGQKGQVVFLDPKGWYLMGSAGPTALLNNVAQLKQAYSTALKQ
ncbi:siderophore ABC transporter substrate-binding protein [Comamonas sp. NoAH]|uniref:siderophore ABC transporter substrate-binding protein n=1 Tax=Comamonas halotolerans TaxID=3041496 RepID=UPI0024E16F54|nr:ABC transporter substrate-binding protein [Comamonas sp. NoAH]